MTKSSKALSILLLLLFLVSTTLSQQQGPPNEKELKHQRERRQAISMVEQTAGEAPSWNDKKAAVQVLTDAADLLWDETPGQGTKWLTKAWEFIEQVSGTPKNEKLKEFFTRSDQSDLRTVVLSVARRHDPELAEKFLKQLSQKEPSEKKDRGAFDDRTARGEQLLQMAQQSVDSNPETAFTLAERSLADGVSYTLQNVLTSLRKKNVEMANRLFDLALARFSSGADPSEAQVLAGYLFQSGFTFSANANGQPILVVNPAQQNLPAVASSEPQRAKNFLAAVYEVLLARPLALDSPEGKQRAQQLLVLGNRLARPYRTFAPELAESAQGFLAHLQRQLSPEGEPGGLSETTRSTATSGEKTKSLTKEDFYEKRISELEDQAGKQNNPIARKLAYVEAALATKPEDYQRGRRIAEKIDDDNDLRADIISFLLYRGALFLLKKAEIEKAAELAPQISDVLQRSVVKIIIAQHLLSPKPEKSKPEESTTLTQQRAFDLLSDIDRDLKKESPSASVAKILLAKTAVLAKLDQDQALISLEGSVQMINKLESFDLRDSSAPDLGLGISATSGATVERPRLGFDFRSAIDPLIMTNFEQIAAGAERFTAKEIRGVGFLEVAKLYLRKDNSGPRKDSIRAAR